MNEETLFLIVFDILDLMKAKIQEIFFSLFFQQQE